MITSGVEQRLIMKLEDNLKALGYYLTKVNVWENTPRQKKWAVGRIGQKDIRYSFYDTDELQNWIINENLNQEMYY